MNNGEPPSLIRPTQHFRFLSRLRSKPPLSILLVILQLVMGMVIGLAPFYATGLGGLYVMQVTLT